MKKVSENRDAQREKETCRKITGMQLTLAHRSTNLMPLNEVVDPWGSKLELDGNVLQDTQTVWNVIEDNPVLKVWKNAAFDSAHGSLGHAVGLVGRHDRLEAARVRDLVRMCEEGNEYFKRWCR